MNKTKEEMQSWLNILSNDNFILQDRVDVLNETIAIINNRLLLKDEHREHLNKTISSQAEQLQVLYNRIEIDKITIKTQEKTIKLYLDNLNNKLNE